jgi:CRP-like cAMP-binding protein
MVASAQRTGNLLLDSFGSKERTSILAGSRQVAIELGREYLSPGDVVEMVYLPISGVISITTTLDDDLVVEAATVGREGFIVAQAILGSNRVGQETYMGQVPGRMILVDHRRFVDAAAHPGRVQRLVHGYLQALFAQTAYGSACNARHSVRQRCARWLLQTHDRVDGDTLELRQEFLAMMLGVQRPSVTIAAGALHQEGLIDYRRGRITILDRIGLEAAACGCYEKIRTEYSRLVPLGEGISA